MGAATREDCAAGGVWCAGANRVDTTRLTKADIPIPIQSGSGLVAGKDRG